MPWRLLGKIAFILVPWLGAVYALLPETDVFTLFGKQYKIDYWVDWTTFIWQLALLLVPAIIGSVLIITLSRRSTSWLYIGVLAEMVFLLVWNIERMIVGLDYIDGHSYLVTFLASFTVVILLLWIRSRRKPSEREKKEALIEALDKLEKQDLQAVYLSLVDIELSVSEMKESDFVSVWKHVISTYLQQGKNNTAAVSQKISNLKNG